MTRLQNKEYKIKINLKSYDHKLVDKSANEIVNTARRAGGEVTGPVNLPTRIKKYTVNRSPHIDKKSREQFEIRVYKRLIEVDAKDGQVVEGLTNLSLPAGVDVKVKLKGDK